VECFELADKDAAGTSDEEATWAASVDKCLGNIFCGGQ